MSFSVLIWVVIKGISLTVVACNHCVFYNKLHFRTFLPRRKVHGQKDHSKAGSGVPASKTMRTEGELLFLGNYSLGTLVFQAVIYQRSVWTKGKMKKYRCQNKNDNGPPRINAEWTGLIFWWVQKGMLGRIKLRTWRAALKALFFQCMLEWPFGHSPRESHLPWEWQEGEGKRSWVTTVCQPCARHSMAPGHLLSQCSCQSGLSVPQSVNQGI